MGTDGSLDRLIPTFVQSARMHISTFQLSFSLINPLPAKAVDKTVYDKERTSVFEIFHRHTHTRAKHHRQTHLQTTAVSVSSLKPVDMSGTEERTLLRLCSTILCL